jgi:hypothetical protein
MSDDEIKTIQQIKKDKKQRKELSPTSKEKRRLNMMKALSVRQSIYKNKKKTDLLNSNIEELLNNDVLLTEDEPKTIIKEKTKKKEDNNDKEISEVKLIKTENKNNDNIYNDLINKLDNINKKVDKMYYIKKNKPPKQQTPIIIDNNAALSKQNNLLEMIKNKMLIS